MLRRPIEENGCSAGGAGRTHSDITVLSRPDARLEEAVAYYKDKLGSVVSWTWGEPVSRAGVALDDVEIQMEGAGLGRSRGATIAMEIGDRPWGMRDFRVIDPSGNRIGFGATQQKEPGVSLEADRKRSTG